MIAVDGRRNGWRHIVLPMARSDQLVMNAVLAVSAFHQEAMLRRDGPGPMDISAITERPREDGVPSPQALYNASIQGLRCRSNLANSSQEDTQATLVAVLVLLVAAMVTGRDDYSTILGMLHSATKVLGGETQLGTSELGGFLVRQVRK